MNNPVKITLIAIAIIASSMKTAAAGSGPEGSLYLVADYCAYRNEDDTTRSYVEIYYNLLRHQLKYDPDSSGYIALIDMAIALRDANGVLIDSLGWTAGSRIESLSALENANFLISDMIPELFPVGRYKVALYARNGGRTGMATLDLDVPSFSGGKLDISTLELAYQITLDSTGKFCKSGHHILPNPSGRFSQDDKIIYIYAEAYNLDSTPGSDSVYSISLDILDFNGETIKSIPPASYAKSGASAAIMTGFSIITLKAGLYQVRLMLTDGLKTACTGKNFTVLQSPSRIKEELMSALLKDFPQAERISNEEDARHFREDMTYIATFGELRLYESLNLEGKANFQKDFWDYRDTDPDSPVNEFKVEHYRRLKYAKDNFSQYAGLIPGWKTDRGRVYIVFGEPSEIERNPSSIESRSWERWWYHGIEGGVYFIFVDFEDTENYTLVHSSKKDEIKDYNWQDKVKMTAFQR